MPASPIPAFSVRYYTETRGWDEVQTNHDYVWAYNVPRYSAPLRGMGTLVYSSGRLELYGLRVTTF